jgi:PAS domain S-box-containing protein
VFIGAETEEAPFWAPLVITRPIAFEGALVGSVWMDVDVWPELETRLLKYLLIVLLVSAGALAVAAVVTGRLQRLLTRPILDLVSAARVVSLEKDYSVRVRAEAGGELGLLVETFNEMLLAIDEREAALREARSQLEQKVQERTRDLERELQDRQRAEAAAQHSQALLARAEALAQIGSWEWDLGGNRMRWSDQLYEVLGADPQQTASHSALLENVHPDDREHVRAEIDRALDGGRDSVTFEHRVVRADGTQRAVQAQVELRRDAEGRPIGLTGTAQDVTLRKEAEREREQLIRAQAAQQAAEAAERRSAVLAGVSADLAGALDYESTLPASTRRVIPEFADWCSVHLVEEGRIRRVAVASEDPRVERLGWKMDDEHPYDPAAAGGIPQVLREGRCLLVETVTDEFLRGHASGEHLAMLKDMGFRSGLFVPLRARDQILGVVSFGMTVSGRRFRPSDLAFAESIGGRISTALDNARLYRDVQNANRMKDEFLATLSHELRTPLNAIVGWTQLLRLGALDPAATQKAVDTIDRNARAQAQLIEDILDVSRIISGKLSLEMAPVELSFVVQAAIDAVRPAADAKQIAIEAELPPGAIVSGDADRLQQVFWNLLSNATKFTPQGGRVRVCIERAGTQAEVRVTDNGVGIPGDFLPHVFERFRQADASSTRMHRGLGLGLAIVRHLIELHGGTVNAASAGTGCGATFSVGLPLATGSLALELPADRAESALAAGALSGISVLVVDDELDTRDVIVASLSRLGAQVAAVGSAREAMIALPERRPDVLIADIEMPEMDGYALVRWMRSLPPMGGGGTPALALTAYARPEDRRAALAAGFQDHLAKPVRPEEMVRMVRRLAVVRPPPAPLVN